MKKSKGFIIGLGALIMFSYYLYASILKTITVAEPRTSELTSYSLEISEQDEPTTSIEKTNCIPETEKEKSEYVRDKVNAQIEMHSIPYDVNAPRLNKSGGVFYGPSGKETYYNLNMSGVVSIMRGYGFSEEEYPYWVREDGVKMLGPYVMVAANLYLRPRGTLIETSLGTGIVCDTGEFAKRDATQIDIAVSW